MHSKHPATAWILSCAIFIKSVQNAKENYVHPLIIASNEAVPWQNFVGFTFHFVGFTSSKREKRIFPPLIINSTDMPRWHRSRGVKTWLSSKKVWWRTSLLLGNSHCINVTCWYDIMIQHCIRYAKPQNVLWWQSSLLPGSFNCLLYFSLICSIQVLQN